MRLFLLFSTLATATAISAKQALDELWTHWLAGASDKYQALYADEVDIYIDPKIAAEGDFKKTGQFKLSEDYTITNILDGFSAAWTEVHDVRYEFFEKDANHVICDGHLVGRRSFNGKNQKMDFIIKVNTDDNGKVNSHEWHLYRSEDLDAHSVLTKVLVDWKNGNVATFATSLAEDFEMDMSGARQPGFEGMDGHFTAQDFFVKMGKYAPLYKDDLSTFEYTVYPGPSDGSAVSSDVSLVRTYNNGAQFRYFCYQSYAVNNMGKIVNGALTVTRRVPMNARAGWDNVIAKFGAGDLQGVIDSWPDDLEITWTGDIAAMLKYFPDKYAKFFAGKTVNKETYAKIYIQSLTDMPFKKIDFIYLSQTVDQLVVRFDGVQTMDGKDVAFNIDWVFKYNSDFQMVNGLGNVLWMKEVEQKKEEL